MESGNIVRIPRSDQDGGFVLLNVASAGPLPLDLTLVATENTAIFVTHLRQSKVKQLREKNFQGTEREWQTLLQKLLLQGKQDGDASQNTADASYATEVMASVGDRDMTITLRKNIRGITQRLGKIDLKKDLNREDDLFDWTGLAAQNASSARDEVSRLQTQLHEQQQTIQKLNAQLEDLVKAKQQHENSMLEKFRDLLNSKKLKIRDQQRLLATAKVDRRVAEHVSTVREAAPSRKPTSSRTSKRKAPSTTPAIESESECEYETMQAKEVAAEAQREQEEEMPEAVTPDRSEDEETADEDDLDAPAPSQPAKTRQVKSQPASSPPPKKGVGSKGKAIEVAKDKKSASPEAPPPRRELPFGKHDTRRQAKQKTPPPAIDDDETDDDEL